MTNFIQNFKEQARNKNLTSADMFALCLYKTIKAKSENKTEILNHFIQRAFSPKKGLGWPGFQNAHRDLNFQCREKITRTEDGQMSRKRFILGLDFDEVFTISEIELFDSLMVRTKNYDGAVK